MTYSDEIDLPFTGEFSLADSVSLAASTAFVQTSYLEQNDGASACLDLALLLEGCWKSVFVRVEQGDGAVYARIVADPDKAQVEDVRAQLRRMLCLDVDGAGFAAVAARDPVIAGLHRRRPGRRPVLFPTPYEAAARAIIGHRIPVKHAATVAARIAGEHGVALQIGDRTTHAFPAPDRLAELGWMQGLAERKVDQLRALGRAAAAGRFDSARLRKMEWAEAMVHLQRSPGIGPFSAELIMLRGLGDSDAFPRTEMRLHRAMAAAYRLGESPDLDALEGIAERWRPYRSWAGLLLRNA